MNIISDKVKLHLTDGEHLVDLEHFYLMSSRLSIIFPDYVGSLENFSNDWSTIGLLYCPFIIILFYFCFLSFLGNIFNLSWNSRRVKDPGHFTSQDKLGLLGETKLFLKKNLLFMKALCLLLWRDYVCFNYKIPLECDL